jgi:hypothetical protein
MFVFACSKRHEPFSHEDSQSNHCACLNTAGNKADLCIPHLPILNASIEELVTGTKHYQNDFIRCLPES